MPVRSMGVHGQLVVVDRAGAVAVEVEVGVAGQVDDRGRVGGRLEPDPHPVRRHLEPDLGDQRPGEALVAVGTLQAEDRLVGAVLVDRPQPAVEAVRAAVEVVAAVVGRHLDRRTGLVGSVEREAAAGDPVGIAADGPADVVGGGEVLRRARVTQHDVAAPAVPAGDLQPVHGGPEREQVEHRTGRRA
jgi:hypothetical protein